ncbi:MAG: 3-isopropylmalate dehydratase large subunit [Haloferacaceae archaeon]
MGQTLAEGLLARAAGRETAAPGDHLVCDVDVVMTQDIHTPGIVEKLAEFGVEELPHPERPVVVMDHMAPSHEVDDANEKVGVREFVDEYGIEHFYDVGTGISHEVLPERGHVRPGELVVGSDSHTTTHGAFGAAGTGLGETDVAYALATGTNWFRVPETVRVEVAGDLGPRVSAKDVLLSLAGAYGTDFARYRAVEFDGPAVRDLSLDDRMTLANMSVEFGAKFGFTPVDEVVTEYVAERTDEPFDPVRPDDDADYCRAIEVDADGLGPQVAEPHNVENVVPVAAAEGVDLDQVFIGSCTNGKLRDLRAAASVIEGEEVARGTRLIVTPASREIYGRAEREGLVRTFNDAGAVVTNATCGACPGLGAGVLGEGETCLAAQNRNFRGRMGHNTSEIYLSSPATAAASAVAGRITDPREV